MKKSRLTCRICTRLVVGTLALIPLAIPALAATEYRSGPRQVLLLELYTSQGCSSCPPADLWMSRLVEDPKLWVDYAPLAFHVDYWDYIGWQDRFADSAYSARQYRYEAEGGISFVYTPGFVLNGHEWRPWRQKDGPGKSGTSAGVLSAKIEAGEAQIRYTPAKNGPGMMVATVALLGFGLESEVVAGENTGRKLTNDFVVLGFEQGSMTAHGDSFETMVSLPSSTVRSNRHAIVVWVSEAGTQIPLQTMGGWYGD